MLQAAANALKNGYNTSLNSTTSSGSSEGAHDGDTDVNDDDVPAKDFAICALDVLSGALYDLTNRIYWMSFTHWVLLPLPYINATGD
jgi:hypothetical protein